MIFKLSSGRSASSARISLKLNTEAFEKTAVAGTDAKKSRSQWLSQNAKLLDEELIPSIWAQQLQPERGELMAVLWPGSALTEVSWFTGSAGLEPRVFMSHGETQQLLTPQVLISFPSSLLTAWHAPHLLRVWSRWSAKRCRLWEEINGCCCLQVLVGQQWQQQFHRWVAREQH